MGDDTVPVVVLDRLLASQEAQTRATSEQTSAVVELRGAVEECTATVGRLSQQTGKLARIEEERQVAAGRRLAWLRACITPQLVAQVLAILAAAGGVSYYLQPLPPSDAVVDAGE